MRMGIMPHRARNASYSTVYMNNYNECWTSKGGKEKKKNHAQQD